MITQLLSNTTADTFDGVIGTIDISVIKPPEPFSCPCVCDCDYEELAFYHSSGDTWKNDSATLLSEVFLSADTNAFEIYKDDVLKATVTDDTYGTYIAVGGYSTQLLKTSFKADWALIQAAWGDGVYYLKSARTILNVNGDLTTHKYMVTEYSDEKAKGTVVIKTVQNGIIEGGNNYIGMEFEQQVRLNAHLSGVQRSLETDRYLSQNLTLEQIQDKVIKNYSLEVLMIPTNIASPLLDDQVMANSIKITNYGYWEYDCHEELEIVLEEFTESLYFHKTKDAVFKLEFTAKKQDLRKRNFS